MNALRRRVRIAIRNAKPQLVAADEAAGSFDKETGKKIVQLLREAANTERTTVLVVTQDEKVTQQADRRLEIEDGVLTEIA